MLEAFSLDRHHVLGQADVCARGGSYLICFTFAKLYSVTYSTTDMLMIWLGLFMVSGSCCVPV